MVPTSQFKNVRSFVNINSVFYKEMEIMKFCCCWKSQHHWQGYVIDKVMTNKEREWTQEWYFLHLKEVWINYCNVIAKYDRTHDCQRWVCWTSKSNLGNTRVWPISLQWLLWTWSHQKLQLSTNFCNIKIYKYN